MLWKSIKIKLPRGGNFRIFKIKMANFENFKIFWGSFFSFWHKDFMLQISNFCEYSWKSYSFANTPKWLTFCLFFTPKKLHTFCNYLTSNFNRNLKLSGSNFFVKSHKMSPKKFQNFQNLGFLFLKSWIFRRAGA